LIRFRDQWLCVFREGQQHVSPDGALRVIASKDGTNWQSIALVRSAGVDLRDPKITQTPGKHLMLTGAGAFPARGDVKHQTYAWFSEDGSHWGERVAIGDPNMWLWRVTWHQGVAWSIGYDTSGEEFVRLYRSNNGKHFSTHVGRLHDQQQPNEHSLVFLDNDTALCVLRRDGKPGHGLLGIARPPYESWEWHDLGRKIGGPHLIRIPDRPLVVGARLYDGGARTSLLWLDREGKSLSEFVRLPSGGDTSYPGLVWHEDRLWISYYSSHEGKTSIYLARVRLLTKSP
jgi:hypothetical protein